MRAVIQRVSSAGVEAEGCVAGRIGQGLMILLGVHEEDGEAQARFLAGKIVQLRIFTDSQDKLNLSLLDVGGGALVVSNFTLYADCKKGRRPSYVEAARPEKADSLYRYFVRCLGEAGVSPVETGVFGAHMLVSIANDGPVTIWMDTAEMMPKG